MCLGSRNGKVVALQLLQKYITQQAQAGVPLARDDGNCSAAATEGSFIDGLDRRSRELDSDQGLG